MNRPLYKKLYIDMIRNKYPEKEALCSHFLEKENWTALDVMEVNDLLFGDKRSKSAHTRDKAHRSYDIESIKQILAYQRNNMLTNREVARHYGLSRNTVAKWKKLFGESI